MRLPLIAGPPRVEGGGSAGAAPLLLLSLLRVTVRLARIERDAVGNDCGGDAGTPDSCWRVTCRRVLAMVSQVQSEGKPSGRISAVRQSKLRR